MTVYSMSTDGRTVLSDGQPFKRGRSASEAFKELRRADPAAAEAYLKGEPSAATSPAAAVNAPEPNPQPTPAPAQASGEAAAPPAPVVETAPGAAGQVSAGLVSQAMHAYGKQ